LATQVNVSVGGTAAFLSRTYNATGNETITRLNVTVGGLFRPPPSSGGPIGVPFYAPLTALVQIGDVAWYEQQLGVTYRGNYGYGEIRIARDRCIEPYDLPE